MSGSHKSRTDAAVGIIAVLIIIIVGFVVSIPVATAVTFPITITQTSYTTYAVSYQTSSLTQVPIQQQTTTNQAIFDIGSTMLTPDKVAVASSNIPTGADVQVSWTTDNTADVWVFNSAEYSAYTQSKTTSPNIGSKTGASGSMSFHVSVGDTYYLVIHDPNYPLGINNKNIQVSSSGTATYNVQTTVYVTQTNTYVATSLTTSTFYVTQTSQSTTTKSCSFSFWQWLAGSKKCS